MLLLKSFKRKLVPSACKGVSSCAFHRPFHQPFPTTHFKHMCFTDLTSISINPMMEAVPTFLTFLTFLSRTTPGFLSHPVVFGSVTAAAVGAAALDKFGYLGEMTLHHSVEAQLRATDDRAEPSFLDFGL